MIAADGRASTAHAKVRDTVIRVAAVVGEEVGHAVVDAVVAPYDVISSSS